MRSELPALLGGAPIRPDGPPAWPLPDPDVQAALCAAVASGAWGQYRGEHVCALEAELAAFHGVPHALTCATGTLAVEVALRALRVGPGDEVVMAAYDYESNFLTVHALGAKPVLVDVRPDNWQLDETKLEAALTPLTKAVLCSHLHGGLVNMPAVLALARPRGVGVVEDAAQAPGAVLDGRPAGTWGDVGTLSFGGSKLLTAGRGGGLLFADPVLFQRAKGHLNRGVQQLAPLSELQAAALRPQLRKLHEATAWRVERVRELFQINPPPSPLPEGRGSQDTLKRLSELGSQSGSGELPLPSGRGLGGGLSFSPLAPLEAGAHLPAFYKLGLRYDPAAFGLSRERLVKALRAEGVAFDAGFNALHVGRSPSRFRAAGPLDHAADAHARCVVLHHPVLSLAPADVRQVAEAVAKVYRYRDELNRPAPTPDPES
ncbi:aminotransferase class V-fold PLP-dependent enzyme [Gemmata sp. JC673]|uniref:Aminotransferase class V-fold PLP-dependent enzyme n=1 Tax=Gemmata algarum TaxID=2975278 RepID=A0ABU5F744_9BACT|nr:aminotransferase class V-fold PLP-dependent enzyme [Gemmata algarum]MDY3561686.1 aminotransferase class V-fold PLP-dependent enzyme [Gemmata algarum]